MRIFAAICLVPVLLGASLSPATADPQEDADFVVSRLVTDRAVDSMLTALRPAVERMLKAPLKKSGGKVLSEKAQGLFIDLYYDTFKDEFLGQFRQELAQAFRAQLSEEALAELAAFLRTPAGQEYADKGPDIQQAGMRIGRRIGKQVGQRTAARVRERLAAEGGDVFKPSERDALIKLLIGDQ